MKIDFFNPFFLQSNARGILKLIDYIEFHPVLHSTNCLTYEEVKNLFLAMKLKGFDSSKYEYDKHGYLLVEFLMSIPCASDLMLFASYPFKLLPQACYITKLRL